VGAYWHCSSQQLREEGEGRDSAMPAGRPKKAGSAGLAAAISRVALAAESVLGGSPRGAGKRRRSGVPAPPGIEGIKKRGGSKKGRVQKKRPKGYQARRRAAVLYQYEVNDKEFAGLDAIPDVPVGGPKRGQPVHIARRIAQAITKEGERPPDTSWVLGILREIHAVGISSYDPHKDGRSAKRKPRKTQRPLPPK
jgi:hypothetical protein